ncbi:MAG: helix-turn-helix domain-containing protein [Clostridia bacterium]|nr:helix-turn-helix domain-containing protein [Clostridia bacterium]
MISDNIRFYRKKANLTQAELGKIVGVGKSNISMYETGDRVPPLDIIEKLADLFGVDINTLTGHKAMVVQIPVLGKVAAGIPIEAVTDIIDYEEISPDIVRDGSEYFALQLKGDSMEPRMSDGDVVIVRKQESIENGQIAIVCVNGYEATCKKVIIKDNGAVILQPLNPTHDPMYFTPDEVASLPITILGRVVELRAKF